MQNNKTSIPFLGANGPGSLNHDVTYEMSAPTQNNPLTPTTSRTPRGRPRPSRGSPRRRAMKTSNIAKQSASNGTRNAAVRYRKACLRSGWAIDLKWLPAQLWVRSAGSQTSALIYDRTRTDIGLINLEPAKSVRTVAGRKPGIPPCDASNMAHDTRHAI